MSTIDWNRPRSWDEICRRHPARRRRVLELVRALGGLPRRAQSRIATALGVHRWTIGKDLSPPRARPESSTVEDVGGR